MKINRTLHVFPLAGLFFCSIFAFGQANLPIDKQATPQTISLYKNLKRIQQKGFMFGHQDDLAYGVNWKYIDGRSDVKDVTGDYPGVYGWELGHLEIDAPVNLDSVPFEKMKQYIREGYERGGVITISWHMNNPLSQKSAWDPVPGTVGSILPGGLKHEYFKSWLDKAAAFFTSLRGKNGENIPIIFRPFHELNGSWFWWGRNLCTPDELKQLWRFTVSYLRDQKQVHNLLYAYNTDRFATTEEYLERYPGDDWVDIVGFDIYQRGADQKQKFTEEINKCLTTLTAIAEDKNKIAALTEFGFNELPDSEWWTQTFLKAVQYYDIAYVLAWRNAGIKPGGESEYYVPYKGQASAKDFVKFYESPKTMFGKEVTKENIYK